MGVLVAGEAGGALVAARGAEGVVTLALEGIASSARAPTGVPVHPLEVLERGALSTDGIDEVHLVGGEPETRSVVRSWAHRRGIACTDVHPGRLRRPPGVRVAAVSAPRTASGKSGVTLRLARLLQRAGVACVVARHPLASLLAWEGRDRTELVRSPDELRPPRPLEEFEELAPLVAAGIPVAIGLDHEEVLSAAARAVGPGGVVVWDGGGSAEPWVEVDRHFVVIDLLRPLAEGALERVRTADVLVLTKADAAPPERAHEIEQSVREWNPKASVVVVDMLPSVAEGQRVMDRRAVVVEDAPSLLFGGLRAGGGAVLARRFRCGVVDPRPFAVGAVARVLAEHGHIGPVVPSLGRTASELADLESTILAMPGDIVLWASPAPPTKALAMQDRPLVTVQTELLEVAGDTLHEAAAPLLGTGA